MKNRIGALVVVLAVVLLAQPVVAQGEGVFTVERRGTGVVVTYESDQAEVLWLHRDGVLLARMETPGNEEQVAYYRETYLGAACYWLAEREENRPFVAVTTTVCVSPHPMPLARWLPIMQRGR
jgi:hypothetical protein